MANERKPDFVCVGPEKTATGWLYKMAGQHPEVWVPPIKELRFLNEGNAVPHHNLKNLARSKYRYPSRARCDYVRGVRTPRWKYLYAKARLGSITESTQILDLYEVPGDTDVVIGHFERYS